MPVIAHLAMAEMAFNDTKQVLHFRMHLPDWPAPGLDDAQSSELELPNLDGQAGQGQRV